MPTKAAAENVVCFKLILQFHFNFNLQVNSMDPDQTAHYFRLLYMEQSDLGLYCLHTSSN